MRRPPSASPSPRPSPRVNDLPSPGVFGISSGYALGVETWRLRDMQALSDQRIAKQATDMVHRPPQSRSTPATRPPTRVEGRLPNSPRPLTPTPMPPLLGSFGEPASAGVGTGSAFAGYMRAIRSKRDAAREIAAPVLSRLSSVGAPDVMRGMEAAFGSVDVHQFAALIEDRRLSSSVPAVRPPSGHWVSPPGRPRRKGCTLLGERERRPRGASKHSRHEHEHEHGSSRR